MVYALHIGFAKHLVLSIVKVSTYVILVLQVLILEIKARSIRVSRIPFYLDPEITVNPDGRVYKPIENDYSILYVGSKDLHQLSIMSIHCHSQFYILEGKQFVEQSIYNNSMLRKRFHLIEKAKNANIIGIVVGTLAVSSYLDVLEKVKKLIKSSGKKYYVLSVGKLNVAKLANFMEIDVNVLIACPENSVVDSKVTISVYFYEEYYKPFITPFELSVALDTSIEWVGKFVTNFEQFLEIDSDLNGKDEENIDCADHEETKGQIVLKNREHQLIEIDQSHGVEEEIVPELYTLEIKEGRKGIPKTYDDENTF
ncbi:Diphthamide synthesis DHP2, eukaryotic domain-containing protein [Rozella allomycis CSF55]|uniref:Diphthamide synthesis DHP2, eukaryotic domain-containing protein n=1 Tax=Rozella allomycis (strain CSF55) TaxID=988480 RepID=A0A075AZN1_ROZAC|nr:Diphthamide synthesis DHP2, eukaryotic domain-containing protein [Rozella allomycis CSF55]|eukprot:EPZ34132.1 Diphthamide synthesis DHP2, eukaryotic domain-containing protein [Rozella allomycis CSF55]